MYHYNYYCYYDDGVGDDDEINATFLFHKCTQNKSKSTLKIKLN